MSLCTLTCKPVLVLLRMYIFILYILVYNSNFKSETLLSFWGASNLWYFT